MSATVAAKLKAVRALLEGAPDSAVRSLALALSSAGAGLAEVRAMADAELATRETVAAVFAPVRGAGRGLLYQPPKFTPARLRRLWTLIERQDAPALQAACEQYRNMRQGDASPLVFEDICRLAATVLREQPVLDATMGEDAVFCLEAAPLVHQALDRASTWLGRAQPEHAAALRLLLRDAGALADDGVSRFLNLLSTHLEDPNHVLRFVSAALDRPNDNYLAASELAGLGEAVLNSVDERIEAAKAFSPDLGESAAREAGRQINTACALLQEFQQCVELSRDGPWGTRVARQKRTLAATVEARLRDVTDVVAAALPMQNVRLVGRMTRAAPKLDQRPPEAAVTRARALTAFMDAVRTSAADGGFGALRAKIAAAAAERVSSFAEETLAALNAFEAPDEALAFELLESAAEFLVLADDAKAAAVVRRRASHAGSLGASQQSA